MLLSVLASVIEALPREICLMPILGAVLGHDGGMEMNLRCRPRVVAA